MEGNLRRKIRKEDSSLIGEMICQKAIFEK